MMKLSLAMKLTIVLGLTAIAILVIVITCIVRSERFTKTIFVSVASYRDIECKKTLKGLFEMASAPDRIIVGICDQFKEDKELCGTIEKYKKNIRTLKLDHKEAKGPLYARALINTLYFNEDYYLMIDSHTTFKKNWDSDLINQILELQKNGIKKPILSVYPLSKDDKSDMLYHLCKIPSKGDYPLIFDTVSKNKKKFKQGLIIAAGFLFTLGSFVKDIRLPASLPYIFNGEEILISMLAFVQGYDVFSPNKNVLSHNYDLKYRPSFWDDNIKKESKNLSEEKIGIDRLKQLLYSITPRNEGSLGKRTAKEFWELLGWDKDKKTIKPEKEDYWCKKSPEY